MWPSTRKTYQQHWDSVLTFRQILGNHGELPASSSQLLLYLAYLFKNNWTHASLQNLVSAIGYKHKIDSVSGPTANFKVQKFLLGAKILSPPSRKLQPVTLDILISILGALPAIKQTNYSVKLLRALMTLVYWGCLRIGEVAVSAHKGQVLHHIQIVFQYSPLSEIPTAMCIQFSSYKHSWCKTPLFKISAHNLLTCPVTALWVYLQVHPTRLGHALFISLPGPTVAQSFFITCPKQALALTPHHNLNINRYTFRIGHTTNLIMAGRGDAYI